MYQLKCQTNIYDKLKELDHSSEWMDFSNYPAQHPNYSRVNHLIPGKFKDEGCGRPYVDGIFLRSKMYSIINENTKYDKCTAKGIDRRVKNKMLSHQSYVEALEQCDSVNTLAIPKIITKSHELFTVTQYKKGLSPYNDKIFLDRGEGGDWITHSFGYNSI